MTGIRSKKGIELSVNFLIVVILSIVMLGLGIMLVQNFFTGTEEIRANLDDQTRSKIGNLLTQGEITALPYNRKSVYTGEEAVFGIGVLNVDKEAHNTFNIKITPTKFVDRDKEVEENPDIEEWLLYDDSEFELAPHEHKSRSILVEVPRDAKSGTYIFNVEVMGRGGRYGNLNKMYVTVN